MSSKFADGGIVLDYFAKFYLPGTADCCSDSRFIIIYSTVIVQSDNRTPGNVNTNYRLVRFIESVVPFKRYPGARFRSPADFTNRRNRSENPPRVPRETRARTVWLSDGEYRGTIVARV